MRFEHVAFDLDGTLIDSRADLAAATNHVLRSFGLAEIAPASVFALVGEGARRLVERALGPERGALVDEGVTRFLAYYREHLLDATALYPGIAETLDALREGGTVLSVLTNKPIAFSRTILAGLGMADRFRDVVGGDSLPTRKPDPAGLHHLRGLTATPPGAMLLVGDSAVDAATARAAGVAFCGVTWGLDPEAFRTTVPERLVGRPEELIAVVAG